jgi:hypothetical protein
MVQVQAGDIMQNAERRTTNAQGRVYFSLGELFNKFDRKRGLYPFDIEALDFNKCLANPQGLFGENTLVWLTQRIFFVANLFRYVFPN